MANHVTTDKANQETYMKCVALIGHLDYKHLILLNFQLSEHIYNCLIHAENAKEQRERDQQKLN